MSHEQHHYPTCRVWVTAQHADCNCPPQRPWRIRLCGNGWEILRWLDGHWEHFLYTHTHQQASALVRSMNWLKEGGFRYAR